MSVRPRTRSGRPVVIPPPREDDFEDVHWALSAATTLWERGEDTEALKWLRRAASAAADRDADVRAVELFKAAADVAGVVEARREVRAARQIVGTAIGMLQPGGTPPQGAPPQGVPPQGVPRGAPHAAPQGLVHSQVAPPAKGPPADVSGRPPFAPRHTPAAPSPVPPAPPTGPGYAAPAPPTASRGDRGGKTGPPPPPRKGARRAPEPRLTQAGPPTHLQAIPEVEANTERRSKEPRDLVPPVPPEPTLSERFAGLGYGPEAEEDTFIRPETMLRRALMAIDPHYADRTEIRSDARDDDSSPGRFEHDSSPGRFDHDSSPGLYQPSPFVEPEQSFVDAEDAPPTGRSGRRSEADDPNDETTRQRVGDIVAAADARKSSASYPTATGPSLIPGIAAFRVAVLPIPEERDVRLLFLAPGTDPPPGVAVALLVPPSEEDARMINEIYNDTDAKL